MQISHDFLSPLSTLIGSQPIVFIALWVSDIWWRSLNVFPVSQTLGFGRESSQWMRIFLLWWFWPSLSGKLPMSPSSSSFFLTAFEQQTPKCNTRNICRSFMWRVLWLEAGFGRRALGQGLRYETQPYVRVHHYPHKLNVYRWEHMIERSQIRKGKENPGALSLSSRIY